MESTTENTEDVPIGKNDEIQVKSEPMREDEESPKYSDIEILRAFDIVIEYLKGQNKTDLVIILTNEREKCRVKFAEKYVKVE